MSIKLLFHNDHNKKKGEPNSESGSRLQYEQTLRIREQVTESHRLTPADELVRVRFIRDYPCNIYRVTLFRRYKESHTVKRKDGGTALLPPGVYVHKQYLAECISEAEIVYTPPLPENLI